MKTPQNKLRLNKRQTARLLELSLHNTEDIAQMDPDQQKEQFLLNTLRSKLPLNRAFEQSLPTLIQSLAEELKSLSGASLGDLLMNPRTPIEVLIRIKDHTKAQGAASQGETEQEVALTVYYAAIASALAYHNAKISEHSCKGLKEAFKKIERNLWTPANLVTLFQTARAHNPPTPE
jgi:hypothetical protein